MSALPIRLPERLSPVLVTTGWLFSYLLGWGEIIYGVGSFAVFGVLVFMSGADWILPAALGPVCVFGGVVLLGVMPSWAERNEP